MHISVGSKKEIQFRHLAHVPIHHSHPFIGVGATDPLLKLRPGFEYPPPPPASQINLGDIAMHAGC